MMLLEFMMSLQLFVEVTLPHIVRTDIYNTRYWSVEGRHEIEFQRTHKSESAIMHCYVM